MESLNIFISYSSQDNELMQQLLKHLKVLRFKRPYLQIWHDGLLEAATRWDDTIKEKLHSAQIVLMLISADFFVSDYIWNIEVDSTLARENQGEVSALPIILKSCDWQSTPIAQFQVLPKKGVPVTLAADRETALYSVIKGIMPVIEKWEKKLGLNPN
jgi:hypothetical protein